MGNVQDCKQNVIIRIKKQAFNGRDRLSRHLLEEKNNVWVKIGVTESSPRTITTLLEEITRGRQNRYGTYSS